MSRIAPVFAKLAEEGRKALIPFVTAGDPDPSLTVPLMHRLVKGGADIIELGVPFSDPMADGPVIQRASERALAHGVRLVDVLAMVREFRQDNGHTPVVLMGYLNPLEAMGYEAFAAAAEEAGVDAALTVDLPAEEAADLVTALRERGLNAIFLFAPTTGSERMKHLAGLAGGFLYYVSLKGVTGASHFDFDEVAARVGELKSLAGLPVGVGFGIRDAEMAARVAEFADAVVVGSRIVQEIENGDGGGEGILARVEKLAAEFRVALDAKTGGRS